MPHNNINDNNNDTSVISNENVNRVLQELRITQNKLDRSSELAEKNTVQLTEVVKELPSIRRMDNDISQLKEFTKDNNEHTKNHCDLIHGEKGLITRLIILELAYQNRWTSPDRLLAIFGLVVALGIAIFKK